MKSIQQTEQLSDRELKAVLRGDEASLGSLIREDAVNVIAGSAGSAVARIMSKTKTNNSFSKGNGTPLISGECFGFDGSNKKKLALYPLS